MPGTKWLALDLPASFANLAQGSIDTTYGPGALLGGLAGGRAFSCPEEARASSPQATPCGDTARPDQSPHGLQRLG